MCNKREELFPWYEKASRVYEYNPNTGVITKNSGKRAGKPFGTINSKGYIKNSVSLNGKVKVIPSHRLAWFIYYGEMPVDQIDHIDGNKTNNKIENLRSCDNSLNQINKKSKSHSNTSFRGVFKQDNGKFLAHIGIDKKLISLGVFDDIKDAKKCRLLAEEKYHSHVKNEIPTKVRAFKNKDINMVNDAMDDSDPVEELQANHEQLKLMQERGEISGTVLIADFYKPIKLDGKKYRTHALFVDVMEESD